MGVRPSCKKKKKKKVKIMTTWRLQPGIICFKFTTLSSRWKPRQSLFSMKPSYLALPRSSVQCRPASTTVVGRAEKFWSTLVAEMCHCIMVLGERMETLWTVRQSWAREKKNLRGFSDDVLTEWTSKVRESHRLVHHWYGCCCCCCFTTWLSVVLH